MLLQTSVAYFLRGTQNSLKKLIQIKFSLASPFVIHEQIILLWAGIMLMWLTSEMMCH